MRRTWLRGRETIHTRYLLHVSGHNLGLWMRSLIGASTPKDRMARWKWLLVLIVLADGSILLLVAAISNKHVALGALFT